MTNFRTKIQHALDMGTFTITPSAGSLSGSRAILRIGILGTEATVELESDDPPASGVFTWDDSTGALVVDLAATTINALGVSTRLGHVYQVTIEKSDGTPLVGPSGYIRIDNAVLDAA